MMRSGLFITLFAEYSKDGMVTWHTESADIVEKKNYMMERRVFEIPEKYEPRTMVFHGRVYTVIRVNGMTWNVEDLLSTDRHGRPVITVPGRGIRKGFALRTA